MSEKSSTESVLLWFRRDLRLRDNPALQAASESGLSVVPFYLWNPDEGGEWALGSASKVWLHASLETLDQQLTDLKSRLLLQSVASSTALKKGKSKQTGEDPRSVSGTVLSAAIPSGMKPLEWAAQVKETAAALQSLAKASNAATIFCNARYEPWAILQEQELITALKTHGINLQVLPQSYLLHEPDGIQTKTGGNYQVFTPFYNRARESHPDLHVIDTPTTLKAPKHWPQSIALDELRLLPTIKWDTPILKHWKPGEPGAHEVWREFTETGVLRYNDGRDQPGLKNGTSSMSPYLHFGEITPRQLWETLSENTRQAGSATFLKEMIWREFTYHVLNHFPELPNNCLKPAFRDMPWSDGHSVLFEAWKRGQTGYPIVDAGMRQLWEIGWMHNRVRMIVGSFLTKHLLISWWEGERWFWDTLVDADLANNSFNWQWIAGCGADASPFFRVFNPILQGEKFDKQGDYIRKWVPELSRLPNQFIHHPWDAPEATLKAAGITLGKTYPKPVVDHNEARANALAAYQKIRKKAD